MNEAFIKMKACILDDKIASLIQEAAAVNDPMSLYRFLFLNTHIKTGKLSETYIIIGLLEIIFQLSDFLR